MLARSDEKTTRFGPHDLPVVGRVVQPKLYIARELLACSKDDLMEERIAVIRSLLETLRSLDLRWTLATRALRQSLSLYTLLPREGDETPSTERISLRVPDPRESSHLVRRDELADEHVRPKRAWGQRCTLCNDSEQAFALGIGQSTRRIIEREKVSNFGPLKREDERVGRSRVCLSGA